MQVQKLSISLSPQQVEFLSDYQRDFHIKSRSEVIKKALILLQQYQLEACYREANSEIDDAFDIATHDGIDPNETW